MERTITVNDSLQDRTDSAIEEVKESLLEYCNENTPDSLPCISNDLDYSGRISEIIDGCVPVYYHEIDTAFYLHKNELVDAYENAGIGDNPLENSGMTAIYCYIQEQVYNWYSEEAEEVFEEWQNEQEAQ